MHSMDPKTSERRLRLVEALTLAARVGVVVLFVWGAWASQRALEDVERTRLVLQAIDEVRLHQLAARMHNRGFLLNADPDEQLELLRARTAREAAIARLEGFTESTAERRGQLSALRALLEAGDSASAALRRSAAQTSVESIRQELRAPGRVNLARVIDSSISTLRTNEEARLVRSIARQREAIELTLLAAGVGVVLIAIIGFTTLRYRRRNTRQLTADAATFRRLAEENPDGVLVHVGYRLVYANPAIAAMLRTAGRPLVGRHVPELVHPDDRSVIDQRTAQLSAEGTPTSPRLIRFVRDDGDICEAEARGAPLIFGGVPAIQVVLRDLSARRDAERALQLSEQRFRAVLEAMDEGVVLHGDDMTIRLSNPAAGRILGLTADQLAGRTPSDPAWRTIDANGAHLPAERHYASIAMRTGRAASGIMGVERAPQSRVWISVTAVPLFRDGGTAPVGVVATFADITAKLALEDQLRQAQKMEVMGRMASGVAHDFNNLLTIIRSASELLRVDSSRAGVTFDTLDDIEAATDRAAALTAHLLTFSRRQHAAPALVDPAEIVRDALPLLRRLAGDSISVEHVSDAGAEPTWIWADPVRFEQVLANLVSNAKDAMQSGGTVCVRVGLATVAESIAHRFGVLAAGKYVTLTVEDTGVGMTGDVLDNLFDPFYTTKPQGRGTGLGLSIVYGVVHEALGTITVASEPGRGTQMTVYWPRAASPMSPSPVDDAPVTDTWRGAPASATATQVVTPVRSPVVDAQPRRDGTVGDLILLVDDEESVRSVVAKQLEANGYVVITADSGRSALAMLRNAAFNIRIVVSDVRMPEMTGIELVSAMASAQIDRPVLLVSGQLDTELPRSWPAGAIVRFLPKPLSGVALRRTVSELVSLATGSDQTSA